jgi:hypothetical protein
MNKLFFNMLAAVILLVTACGISFSQDNHCEEGELKGKKTDEGILYGSDFNNDPTAEVIQVTFADVLANPENYNGKIIKLEGNITEVCQTAGCWAMISDGEKEVRVITQHKFLLPKNCAASNATVEGTFKIKEITEEQARHYNDEAKNPKVKTEDITGPQKVLND